MKYDTIFMKNNEEVASDGQFGITKVKKMII